MILLMSSVFVPDVSGVAAVLAGKLILIVILLVLLIWGVDYMFPDKPKRK